ncbi:hypothetical protein CDQ85_15485 [Clostridium thermosuccinogenes]|nr:hypothetical protein CDO33_17410 [Pseudoclostridium thermosuccinogenes]PNT95265.1 hypothetical protein CDQ85_15485 [Pseudoclostridium thermosuccinogenes]
MAKAPFKRLKNVVRFKAVLKNLSVIFAVISRIVYALAKSNRLRMICLKRLKSGSFVLFRSFALQEACLYVIFS